jgi:hypothetical protein
VRRKLATGLLAVLLAGTAAGAAEFWEKKKYTQWSKRDVEKMLTNSPWAEDFEDTDVNIDPLQNPAISADPPQDERGMGAGEPGNTDVGLRARQPVARLIYHFQIRSALPIRQALVRRAQLLQDYERMPAEKRQAFDQDAERFLNADFADRIVIFAAIESNIENDLRELTRHWQTQTTGTLKNSVFLIGGQGRKVELQDFMLASKSGDAFQFTFPRTVGGEPVVGPADKNLQLEFVHPGLRGKQERRVLVEFKLKKMLVDGQLEY